LRLKRSKVKVATRSNMVKKGTLGILKVMHSNIVDHLVSVSNFLCGRS